MEMVNITPLCVATLLATCNPSTTEIATTEGDSVQQSTDYNSVDSQQLSQWFEREMATSPLSNPRSVLKQEVVDYLIGYKEHQEEQERLAELERQRIAEEQARLEEQRRQEELARIERERIANEFPNKGYRQTYYSVAEGELNLGAGYNVNSREVSVINNVMNFYDNTYGNLPIYAIDMNEVLASGLNSKGTPNLYGSVIEIEDEYGNRSKGIILDACGACRYAKKIDLWTYNNNQSHDVSNLKFRYLRYGWNNYTEYHN